MFARLPALLGCRYDVGNSSSPLPCRQRRRSTLRRQANGIAFRLRILASTCLRATVPSAEAPVNLTGMRRRSTDGGAREVRPVKPKGSQVIMKTKRCCRREAKVKTDFAPHKQTRDGSRRRLQGAKSRVRQSMEENNPEKFGIRKALTIGHDGSAARKNAGASCASTRGSSGHHQASVALSAMRKALSSRSASSSTIQNRSPLMVVPTCHRAEHRKGGNRIPCWGNEFCVCRFESGRLVDSRERPEGEAIPSLSKCQSTDRTKSATAFHRRYELGDDRQRSIEVQGLQTRGRRCGERRRPGVQSSC